MKKILDSEKSGSQCIDQTCSFLVLEMAGAKFEKSGLEGMGPLGFPPDEFGLHTEDENRGRVFRRIEDGAQHGLRDEVGARTQQIIEIPISEAPTQGHPRVPREAAHHASKVRPEENSRDWQSCLARSLEAG